MHAFDSFRFYLPSPCVVDVVHVDRVVEKISHIYSLVSVTILNIEHDSFSRIVNIRFIDKTINFTTAHCNNDFSTPSPTLPLSQGGAGVGERRPGAPEGRARVHYTRCTTVISQQSIYTGLYSNLLQSLCNSQCATVNVQHSMYYSQRATVAFS